MGGFEIVDEPRRQPLLLASISTTRKEGPKVAPLLAVFRNLNKHGGPGLPHSHKLSPAALGQAGEELQRAAAIVGSIIIAGAGHLTQQLAKAKVRANKIKHGRPLPFHQSFSLPWTHRQRSSQ
jgi:hypothetical protein